MNIVVPFRSTVYYKMNVMCTRIFLKISARKKPVTDFPDSENKSIALKILNKRLYRLKRTNADYNINDRLCLYSGNRSTSNMLNVNRHRPKNSLKVLNTFLCRYFPFNRVRKKCDCFSFQSEHLDFSSICGIKIQ